MTQRRVLMVTAYVPPTGSGGTIRITKLVRYLAPLGWAADLGGDDPGRAGTFTGAPDALLARYDRRAQASV